MLVDDHALVRMGFRMLLAACEDLEVVAEADNGEEALQRLAQGGIDLVVLDLSMPGMGGLETLRRLRARDTRVGVLVLSAHDDSAHARRALDAGAQGFLSKRGAPEALTQALRCVADGRRYLDAGIAQQLALAALDGSHHPADALSAREFEVFVQLARGRSVQEIAGDLNLSTSTVGTHLYHVKQKLNASNQAELTLLALRWGLIER
ncbi:MAG: response regulator transcription factor [Burkholderiales bacterium]|jgi:two-component system invasion response regulator UvrY|nr:response regulator transcription factor [Burkholderiales bacterium]MBP7519025.1 response regulator transcription factor [Leptothrix sp. (in: b-proteobacteria)]HQY07240.1 response regulator transcription factor [Burkholderiaceae bacterium]